MQDRSIGEWGMFAAMVLLLPLAAVRFFGSGYAATVMAVMGWFLPRLPWAPRWPLYLQEIVSGMALPFILAITGGVLALFANGMPPHELWNAIANDPQGGFAYYLSGSAELWPFFFLTGLISVLSRDITWMVRRLRARRGSPDQTEPARPSPGYPFSTSRMHEKPDLPEVLDPPSAQRPLFTGKGMRASRGPRKDS